MRQRWFSEARFGLFIHWGIYSVPGQGEWAMYHNEWNYNFYDNFAKCFNPIKFDPEAWAELAWNAGMRYVVFTTKHHDGFCMYDSKYTDFKITNTPYGKDITAELITAFRQRGFKIGLYHSLVDWRHPHFMPDPEHPDWKRGARDFSGRDVSKYRAYLYNQIHQLLSEYGEIDLLFFDYTSKHKTSAEWEAEKMLDFVYSLQPKIIVNDRLTYEKKSEVLWDYCTPEISIPNQPVEINGKAYDWETCMTMNNNWGYCAADKAFKSTRTILEALVKCVSQNGNLLLNIGPDALGNIPKESITIMTELASWMNINSESVHQTVKASLRPPYGMTYTQKGNVLYLHLFTPPMGDVILPELNGKIRNITLLTDGAEVPMITHWGTELLNKNEIRIRPPATLPAMSVLKINLYNQYEN